MVKQEFNLSEDKLTKSILYDAGFIAGKEEGRELTLKEVKEKINWIIYEGDIRPEARWNVFLRWFQDNLGLSDGENK